MSISPVGISQGFEDYDDESYQTPYEGQLSGLHWDLTHYRDRNPAKIAGCVEKMAAKVGEFYQQLPQISLKMIRIQDCLEFYEKISFVLIQMETADSPEEKGFNNRVRQVLKTALESLQLGMQQLADGHPRIVEARMLQMPELYYTSFDLTRERLSYLREKDFIFAFASRMQAYSLNNNLPSRLYELRDHLSVLNRDELVQLGSIIFNQDDRTRFAETFGIEGLEEMHQLQQQTTEIAHQTLGFNGGICFACSLMLTGQEILDPTTLDFEKMKSIQDVFSKFWESNYNVPGHLRIGMLPEDILEEVQVQSPVSVLDAQPIDKLIELTDTWKEGRFLMNVNCPMPHTIFLSFTDRAYCDINDLHFVFKQLQVRSFASNEEMVTYLSRYLQIKYSSKVNTFSLVKIDRR